MWSRSFLSSLAAIISAGPPFGHRMMGIEPVSPVNVPLDCLTMTRVLTHGYCHAEKPADNPIYIRIDLLVAGVRAIHRPVCVLAHAQTEEVGLADDEVQVLIEHLTDVLCRPSLSCLRSEVFQQRPGDR